ncbi:MAG: SGNH/GDSL hydrolase family protein [Clostridia bacterium]|nr:SGNH/GDSL hydrolase family protein [Clostridia bacterium]
MNIYEYMSVEKDEKPLDRIVTDGGFCGIFRTIGCIGDSLSSGEFESINKDGSKEYHDFYEYSWGQFIARSTGSKVYNFSQGGMTAKLYDDFANRSGFWKTDKLCQAYIIALGVNDILNRATPNLGSLADIDLENYENNADTFAGNYAKIIQRLKKLQPRAKFFLVSIPRYGDETDEKKRLHRDLLIDLSKLFTNTYVVDLYEYAPVYDQEFFEKYWLGHMNPMGYVLSARMIESYIDYLIRKNPQDFNQVGFIGTELYYQPEK